MQGPSAKTAPRSPVQPARRLLRGAAVRTTAQRSFPPGDAREVFGLFETKTAEASQT
jgi:hypothetical protein